MYNFGIPTLIELETLEENASLCQKLGCSFLELNMNLPQYQLNLLEPAVLADISRKYGITYTIHLDENLNVADFNPEVAGAWLNTVLYTIEFARSMHIPLLNMHLAYGVYFTLPGRKVFLFERYRDLYLERMRLFRDICERAICENDIIICIENTNGYTPLQIEVLDLLLQSPVFGLTLDVGHDYCSGHMDLEVILARKNCLRHIHLHDAARKTQDHLTLGTGELNLDQYMLLAKQLQCTVVLETKTVTSIQESMFWLKNSR